MTESVTKTGVTDAVWQRPRIRPEVSLGPTLRRDDADVHYVKDPRTGWFYRLGEKEFFVVSRMDGTRTIADIEREYAERFDRRLGPESWKQIFTMLGTRQLIDGAVNEDALRQLREARARDAAGNRRPLLLHRFAIVDPDRRFTALAKRLSWLFSPAFVVPALAVTIALLALVATRASELVRDLSGYNWTAYLPVSLIVTWLVLGLHECAHGLTCKHYGGDVHEIGVMWRFPVLAPYCKTDDVKLFACRRHRVYTAFAGMFVSLLAMVPFAAWWLLADPGSWSRGTAAAILLIGTFASLLNLVPFLQLDGYHMINHALGMDDLRRQTYRYWAHLLVPSRRKAPAGYRAADRIAYLGYGLASAAVFGWIGWLVVRYWFDALSQWVGPIAAAAILLAEACLVVAFLGYAAGRRVRSTST